MKKFVSLLLALVMVLSLAACGSGDKPAESKAPDASKAPEESQGPAEFVPMTYEDEAVYMGAMGEYYEAMQKAKEADDVDEMYALLALAEAKLMESGTFLVWRGDGGGYRMSRYVDKSVPTATL